MYYYALLDYTELFIERRIYHLLLKFDKADKMSETEVILLYFDTVLNFCVSLRSVMYDFKFICYLQK